MSKKKQWKSPFQKQGKFYLKKEKQESFFFDTIPSLIQSLTTTRKKSASDMQNWFVFQKPTPSSKEPVITWIGHASFLIQLGNVNIVTDPIFGNSSWLFPRYLPPGITLGQLPNIDIVLLSHNHRDHMDRASLHGLKKHVNTHFLVPKGDKHWFDKRSFERVKEHEWWQCSKIVVNNDNEKHTVSCTFLPAVHWSQRGLWDKNRSLWGSWIIEGYGYKIYFAGDTAYDTHFLAIADEFSRIDIALIPVGPCEPRSWMKHSHINPEEAGKAFLDINAQHFVPMHWGTFFFGVDSFADPINRLHLWWDNQQKKLARKHLHVLKVGQPLLFDASLFSQTPDISHSNKKDKQKENQ